jgi:hypothetical protein
MVNLGKLYRLGKRKAQVRERKVKIRTISRSEMHLLLIKRTPGAERRA